jgi:hypothetical protein
MLITAERLQQTIQGGWGHDGIDGEDLAPLSEGLVAGKDDRLLGRIELGSDLETQLNAVIVPSEMAIRRSQKRGLRRHDHTRRSIHHGHDLRVAG